MLIYPPESRLISWIYYSLSIFFMFGHPGASVY